MSRRTGLHPQCARALRCGSAAARQRRPLYSPRRRPHLGDALVEGQQHAHVVAAREAGAREARHHVAQPADLGVRGGMCDECVCAVHVRLRGGALVMPTCRTVCVVYAPHPLVRALA